MKLPKPVTVRYAQTIPGVQGIPAAPAAEPMVELDPTFIAEGIQSMPDVAKDVITNNPEPMVEVISRHPEVIAKNPAVMDSLMRDANFPVYLSHQPAFVNMIVQNPAFAQWLSTRAAQAAQAAGYA